MRDNGIGIQADSDTLALDTLAAGQDTLGEDTLALCFTSGAPVGLDAEPRTPSPADSPWVLTGLLLLLLLVCVRFRKNIEYFFYLFRSLASSRVRPNMFTNTVGETTFTLLLNVVGVVACGILVGAWTGLRTHTAPTLPSMALCCCVTALYAILMPLLYNLWGYMFTSRSLRRLWSEGFLAAQAITGILLVLPALLVLFYPYRAEAILIVAAALFLLVKIVFIFKGLRIFITDYPSLLIFSYYLCALEIVPLIAVAASANLLCMLYL